MCEYCNGVQDYIKELESITKTLSEYVAWNSFDNSPLDGEIVEAIWVNPEGSIYHNEATNRALVLCRYVNGYYVNIASSVKHFTIFTYGDSQYTLYWRKFNNVNQKIELL